jgi:hypothetical protein
VTFRAETALYQQKTGCAGSSFSTFTNGKSQDGGELRLMMPTI